ncbi:MalM family protein [Photobacterium nomapromontoriensis]|uniref:MalM family protein n=1 Tax=Photobacterium nomapromontoriensis TaxID=2910237 RepID=UPI003D09EEA1
MNSIKTTLAALLVATLAGCATSQVVDLPSKDIVITQQACCEMYSEFAWIPMQGENIDFAIDEYSQVGEFEDGRSYFAGFVLPKNVERMQVELKSWMRSSGVLAPKVLLLSPEFQVVKTIELMDFDVKLSDMFRLSSYQDRFTMDQATTPYMVVYSPFEYRQGEIQIPHPERVRAEELGLARPMVTDPTIEHQKYGLLELDLKPLALRSYRAGEVTSQEQAAANVKEAVPSVAKEVALTTVETTKAASTASYSMLPESEAFYNSQIKAAVASKDMKKALKLMEEAKRAGSPSAEATFLELIQH